MTGVCAVVGTRPEIVKMAPVIHELRRRGAAPVVVHTGQHYDDGLSGSLLRELRVRPTRVLRVGSGSHGRQTARALVALEAEFLRSAPGVVVAEGDTNTVLAAALAAAKLGIPVAHLEAGLRSRDLRMPEEHNRRLVDHLSALLLAPTREAARNLAREDCWGRVVVTGNTVIDACLENGPRAARRPLPRTVDPPFALATVHRAENVDDAGALRGIAAVLRGSPAPVVLPLHPRTRARLRAEGLLRPLADGGMRILPPLGYLDFLGLLMRCEYVLTDSGGVQEEATAPNVRKKVFVLRRSTERPEAVRAGFAEVVGTDPRRALPAVRRFLRVGWDPPRRSPYGDGRAAQAVCDALSAAL